MRSPWFENATLSSDRRKPCRSHLAIANLLDFSASVFQPTWMLPTVKDRQDPNFLLVNYIINAVELEPMYWRPAHIGKADSMQQRRLI